MLALLKALQTPVAREAAGALVSNSAAITVLPRLLSRAMSTNGPSKPSTTDADTSAAAGVAAAAAADAANAAEAAGAAASGAGSAAGGPTAGTSGATAADLGDYHTFLPRIVVFGGNGYVGSRVCQQGLAMGAAVVSINRSGRPRNLQGDWVHQVEWVKGDALDPQQPWRDVMKGASGVVSTMGAFGSNDLMYKVCGEANMRAMDVATEAGVPRFAFISVHDYKFPAGWHAQDFLLKGYFQGKRDAEQYMQHKFPTGGVALRPGFIYGSRAVGSMHVHLNWVGAPLKAALSLLPTQTLANIPIIGAGFVPPVSVDAVAKAAVNAVLDPAVPAGIMDVWAIEKYS